MCTRPCATCMMSDDRIEIYERLKAALMDDRNTVWPLPCCIRFQKERIAFDRIRMWEDKEEVSNGFKGRRRNKYFTRTIWSSCYRLISRTILLPINNWAVGPQRGYIRKRRSRPVAFCWPLSSAKNRELKLMKTHKALGAYKSHW